MSKKGVWWFFNRKILFIISLQFSLQLFKLGLHLTVDKQPEFYFDPIHANSMTSNMTKHTRKVPCNISFKDCWYYKNLMSWPQNNSTILCKIRLN